MNRGRIQAQGGGIEKSSAWTTNNVFTKSMGIERVNDLDSQLSVAERNLRDVALDKSRQRINSCGPNGIPATMKKSFYNDYKNKKIRIDVEVRGGVAFINDPENA